MCDSTPDISYRDQHALVIQHVTGGEVKDSFPGFLKWSEKLHSPVVSGILDAVKKLGLKFEDCGAISFDNASVMVGSGPSRAR